MLEFGIFVAIIGTIVAIVGMIYSKKHQPHH